jgi:hypothetical protein
MSRSNLEPGKPGPGRPPGSRNKTTKLAKEAITLAFEDLGGAEALTAWASASEDNRKVFYTQIWTKVIPLQVSGEDGGPIEHLHEIRRTIVRPGD